MNSFWIAWLVAITSVAVAPLTALAQAGSNSGDKPTAKRPVGDFDPPRNTQIQIIDDGQVVHDYRSIPQAPVSQAAWKKSAYEDLWKATCETSPDIQFVIQKLSFKDQHNAQITQWLTDIGKSTSPRDYRVCPNPISDIVSEGRNSKKAVLNQSECIALLQMVVNLKERLDKAYEQYLSTDDQVSKLARSALLEMAGPAAVARLDQTIANHHRSAVIPNCTSGKQSYVNSNPNSHQATKLPVSNNSIEDFLGGRSDKYAGFDARGERHQR